METKEEDIVSDAELNLGKAAGLTRRGRERRLTHDVPGYEEAAALLKEAVELAPAFAPAYAELAETYAAWGFRRALGGQEHQSLYDLSLSCAERSLALDPSLAAAHRATAVALKHGRRAGDAHRRVREAAEAVALAPDDPECLLEKWRVDGYDIDDPALRRVFSLCPGLIAAHFDLGAVLCTLGRHREALAELEKAIALDPKNLQTYYEIARVLDRMGLREKAVALLRKAETISPGDPLIAFGLSLLGAA